MTSENESDSRLVVSNSLRPHGLYSPWNSLGQNTGVGRLSLLQGIFPTQGLNPGLLHCRQILYQLRHKGSPRILEKLAYSFSRRSSGLRNQTGVSCIAGGFFTNWATREALQQETTNVKGKNYTQQLKQTITRAHIWLGGYLFLPDTVENIIQEHQSENSDGFCLSSGENLALDFRLFCSKLKVYE